MVARPRCGVRGIVIGVVRKWRCLQLCNRRLPRHCQREASSERSEGTAGQTGAPGCHRWQSNAPQQRAPGSTASPGVNFLRSTTMYWLLSGVQVRVTSRKRRGKSCTQLPKGSLQAVCGFVRPFCFGADEAAGAATWPLKQPGDEGSLGGACMRAAQDSHVPLLRLPTIETHSSPAREWRIANAGHWESVLVSARVTDGREHPTKRLTRARQRVGGADALPREQRVLRHEGPEALVQDRLSGTASDRVSRGFLGHSAGKPRPARLHSTKERYLKRYVAASAPAQRHHRHAHACA